MWQMQIMVGFCDLNSRWTLIKGFYIAVKPNLQRLQRFLSLGTFAVTFAPLFLS